MIIHNPFQLTLAGESIVTRRTSQSSHVKLNRRGTQDERRRTLCTLATCYMLHATCYMLHATCLYVGRSLNQLSDDKAGDGPTR